MKQIILGALAIITVTAHAQVKENLISKDSLDRIFNNVVSPDGPATGVLLLGATNNVLYKSGFGFADISQKRKADNLTQFNIGSISKSFTALAIMQLVEKGKLSVTDTIGKFFPGFPKGNKIKIYHLLTHTSGLSNTDNIKQQFEMAGLKEISDNVNTKNVLMDFMGTSMESYLKTDGIFKLLQQKATFSFEPGAEGKWEYSNKGYLVLAKVIEKVTGQQFVDYMRQNIFLPLGMKNTFVYDGIREDEIRNYASSYVRMGSSYQKVFGLIPGTVGDGNIYTTLDDWILYEKCLSGDFPNVISKNSLNEIFKKQVAIPANSGLGGPGAYYGYGWIIKEQPDGSQTIMHTGGVIGVNCITVKPAGENFTIVIFSTTTDLFDIMNAQFEYFVRNGIIKPD